jgi:hypothetical protein
MRFLAAYIMRGRMQAILVASTLAILSMRMPPLSVLSMAAVALVTLRNGPREGLIVLLVGAIATALLGMFLVTSPEFAFAYGVFQWLPIWLIAIVLRVTRKMATAIEVAVFLGILIVIGVYTVVSDPAGLWNGLLNTMMQPMLESAGDNIPLDEIKLSIDRLAHYMTGMVAAGSIFGLLLGLLLGRWWQSCLFNPGGFRQEFTHIKTSPKFAVTTLVIIVFALLSSGSASELAWNISVPLLVLYTFIGTAIIHVLLAARKNANIMMPLFYGAMFMLSLATPAVIVPIAITGLSDTWLNLRDKISNKTDQQ